MQTSAHTPTGAPTDSLMVQIDETNVLQVHHELRLHADLMKEAQFESANQGPYSACGGDVVSVRAGKAFKDKIDQIKKVHDAHRRELSDAADRLRDAARQYGYTDTAIDASFADARDGIAARLTGIRSAPPAPRPAGN